MGISQGFADGISEERTPSSEDAEHELSKFHTSWSHSQQCRVDKLPRMGSVESHGLLAIRLWELYRCYQACHLIRAVEIEDPVNHRFWSF